MQNPITTYPDIVLGCEDDGVSTSKLTPIFMTVNASHFQFHDIYFPSLENSDNILSGEEIDCLAHVKINRTKMVKILIQWTLIPFIVVRRLLS